MNILHMKYVVSIAENGSINKAAEELHVAQPNLSRVLREMEASLGITFFRRTSRGMLLTPDGEKFIAQARKILEQVDSMERMYSADLSARQKFSLSAPRASYISEAFACFSRTLGEGEAELYYHETNSLQAVRDIQEAGYNLGIIRYPAEYDQFFKDMLAEKNLEYDLVAEFRHVLVMNETCLLAKKEALHYEDLRPFIQIAHADSSLPALPLFDAGKEEPPEAPRRIFVFERGSQMDLLAENPDAYMWVSPMPESLLRRMHLVQRVCLDNRRRHKDMMIYQKDYKLTALDKCFVTELCQAKRRCFRAVETE